VKRRIDPFERGLLIVAALAAVLLAVGLGIA
jgi:hypothetical protein